MPLAKTEMKRSLLAVGLVILGCSKDAARQSAGLETIDNSEPVWTPNQVWQVPATAFLEMGIVGPDSARVFQPRDVYRDSRGRYVVADGGWGRDQSIVIFDSTGTVLKRFGRSGDGPGEFGELFWVRRFRGDSIAAYDFVTRKVLLFTPDGTFAGDVSLRPILSVKPSPYTVASDEVVGVFKDGGVLAYRPGFAAMDSAPGVLGIRHELVHIDRSGREGQVIGTFLGATWRFNSRDFRDREEIPLSPKGLLAVGDSTYFENSGEDFLVREFDEAGHIIRVFGKPYTPRAIDARDKAGYEDWYLDALAHSPEHGPPAIQREKQRLRTLEYPEHIPAVSALKVDADGNVWLEAWSKYALRPRATIWSVFRPDGRWLGDVTVPAGVEVSSLTSSQVLGFWFDEYDQAHVRAYPLEKGKANPEPLSTGTKANGT